jgi:hypothetical protein
MNQGCLSNDEVIATKVARNTQAMATTTEENATFDQDSLSDQTPDSQDAISSECEATLVCEETMESLNFAAGPAGSILDRINQQSACQEGQVKSFEEVKEKRRKRVANGDLVSLLTKRVTAGSSVQHGMHSVNEAAPCLNEKAENKEQVAQAAALEMEIKDHRSSIGACKKGLNVQDTLPKCNWTSADHKSMIQFKRLWMLQDHAKTIELTTNSNGGNKNKKGKQPGPKLKAVPSKIAGQKAMWENHCGTVLDPEMPAPSEGCVSNDENGGCFSSADEDSVCDDNGGHFSSAKSSSDCNDGGRFSSANEESIYDDNGDRFSSSAESSYDDDNGGRFSSADDDDGDEDHSGLEDDGDAGHSGDLDVTNAMPQSSGSSFG